MPHGCPLRWALRMHWGANDWLLLLLPCAAAFTVVDILAAAACQLKHALEQAMAAAAKTFHTLSAIAGKRQALKISLQALLPGLLRWLMLPLPPSACLQGTYNAPYGLVCA